uniref:Guanine nucleotide-binding protein subunit gamma n=1 Tax=Ursus maritimus TaxID=29073 RepID=A0A452T2I3_URSMA
QPNLIAKRARKRTTNEQLKLEANMEKIKVFQAAAELQEYCMQNVCRDALLVGIPARSNRFQKPRFCALS